jgi:hypothetical protein
MSTQRRPSSGDYVDAARVALSGIRRGDGLAEVAGRLAPLHPKHNTFPAEVLLGLAADAIDAAGATRDNPIEFADIRKRYLPEDTAHTKAQHHKIEYAIRAAAMIRAGVDPDLLGEFSWWRTDDLWEWALDALVIYVRAAAAHSEQSVADICDAIANKRELDLEP